MFSYCAMLLAVSRRFSRTIWRTFAMFSSVLLVAGRPEPSSSVVLSLPSEKRVTHLLAAVFYIALSPKTCTDISLILLPLLPSLTRNLMFVPTFWRRHTETHSHNNRRHSERDSHRSTTTQLWNADMPISSNHTEVSVHCCHGKHTMASSRTVLSVVIQQEKFFLKRINISCLKKTLFEVIRLLYKEENFVTI
jgi:hypothetical protein